MAESSYLQGNKLKKVLYFCLIAMALSVLFSLLYYRYYGGPLGLAGGNGPVSVLLNPPPVWYRVINTKDYRAQGAATGFKVELKRFRQYKADTSLKELPLEPQRTGLITDKCEGLTKWAVITTIAPETTTTMTVLLESSPDFCLVIVGDRKSPASYEIKAHKERVVYLTIDDQTSLPLDLIALTPENSFARKNIGFLYAIANGAKIILDMDDDNVPIELNGMFFPMEEKMAPFMSPIVDVKKEGHVWNPYPYYGILDAWPRGFPLNRIVPLNRELKTRKLKCLPIVQQYMANRDPDVDAIYRLSHPLPQDYKADRKSVVLPHGVYCPYNAQATMHLSESFWSMLLPHTVNGRVADIWRSYITQYIMSYIPDTCLMFAPPAVRHERNSHNYIKDFSSELPLYLISTHLVEMFATTPPQAASLGEVLRNTYVWLFELGLLEEEDVKYVIAWINDLNKVGYKFPQLG